MHLFDGHLFKGGGPTQEKSGYLRKGVLLSRRGAYLREWVLI